MQPSDDKQKRWLTKDFVEQFRLALGRDMTMEERRFFGLDDPADEWTESCETEDR